MIGQRMQLYFLTTFQLFEQIMLVPEVEDVVFQKDPFELLGRSSSSGSSSSSSPTEKAADLNAPPASTELAVALENTVTALSPLAISHIIECYNVQTAFFLAPFTLSSPNLVIGSYDSILQYLTMLSRELDYNLGLSSHRSRQSTHSGDEGAPSNRLTLAVQSMTSGKTKDNGHSNSNHTRLRCASHEALHNFVLYSGQVGDPRTLYPLNGNDEKMVSLNYWPWSKLPEVDKKHRVLSKHGRVVAIVRGYSRDKKTAAALQKKYHA